MTRAILNKDNIAIVAGEVTIFNYISSTREYLGTIDEFLPMGIGIPANSCNDGPGKSRPGYAICRKEDLSGWEYVIDHRGDTVYSTADGTPIQISKVGDYPSDTTLLKPVTPFDKWDGGEWVTDEHEKKKAAIEAAKNERTARIIYAGEVTQMWQTQLLLGIITDEDKKRLVAWMKYIQDLQLVDDSKAPDAIWPKIPSE